MSLIDTSYFIGELNIPNTDKPHVNEALDAMIKKYEERFLRELLGHTLYSDFKAGLAVGPVAEKWTNLRSGATYSYNQKTYYYPGLLNCIANYVYYWYMRNNASDTTGVGEVISKTDNAVRVSPSRKMVRAWNEMVDDIWKVVSYLDANVTIYTGWNWYGDTNGLYGHVRMKDIFYPINSFNL